MLDSERTSGDEASSRIPEDPRPLWIRRMPGRSFPRLEGDLEVDVAVIGAGIAGLTVATLLADAGRRVAVIDAHEVARGETGHTTAHLSECTDARAKTLLRRFGKEKARLALEAGRAALRQIEGLIARRGILCDFKSVPGYLYTERDEGLAELEAEHEALRALGWPVTFVRGPIPLPYPTLAALRFEDQAQFHVRKYLLPLAEALEGAGCYVFENTRAVEIEDGGAPRVVTDSGVIRARDVVVATNVPLNKVFLQTKIAHYRSYAIGCHVAGALPEGLFWDDEQPYHYIRSQPLDGMQLLIVGGEDHRTGRHEDTTEHFERLAAWTAARFHVRCIEYRWSGQIIEPVDGLPYIGRNSFQEHVWEATGFAGNGMTFGTLAGMSIADAILLRTNPWLELFAATRITPVASAREYVAENVEFPKRFIADRLKRDRTDVAALEREDGGIFAVEGHRVAVYRDKRGELRMLSPVCTHLRCVVEFNRAEQTWDCPCHGSRFDVEGKVVNGPAMHGLAPFEWRASEARSA